MERVFCIAEKLVNDLRKVRAEEAAHSGPAPDADSFHPNCLIVEDDDNDAELAALAIEAVGNVSATIAKTGDEAIDLLNKAVAGDRPPFHIVFLDLNLIGSAAQGYHVLTHIRKIAPHIHVVIVSGFIDQGILNFLARDAGTGGYIGIVTKPLHRANLKEILAKHRMNPESLCKEVLPH